MTLRNSAGQRKERGSVVKAAPRRITEDGVAIDPLYTPEHIVDLNYQQDLGYPGEPPFTRHPYATGYLERLWQMRLYSGFGNAEDTNARWKFLLNSGNMGVSAAFDMPSQLGMDSDNPQAAGEIGRVGVAVDTLKDFEIMFRGVPLDKVAASLNTGDSSIIMFAMLVAVAEKQGVPLNRISGSLSNDILCEYVARGTWLYPPKYSLRLNTDITEYSVRHMPRYFPHNVRGILVHESHGSPAQEIGFSFAAALEYLDRAVARGISIDDVGPRISFFFGAGTRIFEEAAKFRAARRLWARTVRERYSPTRPEAMCMRFTSCFGGHWYRAKDPMVNVARAAYGVLGCVLGGTQGMLLGGYDEAFALPTERTQRLALQTQQVCAYETDATATVDPLGGSYFVETLTNKIEADTQAYMKHLQDMGGILEAVQSGAVQRGLADRYYQIRQAEERGERLVVGVNLYASEEPEPAPELHAMNPDVARRQIQRLHQVKAERDTAGVEAALDRLAEAVNTTDNLVPVVVQAVSSYATMGEITGVFKRAFGSFQEPRSF